MTEAINIIDSLLTVTIITFYFNYCIMIYWWADNTITSDINFVGWIKFFVQNIQQNSKLILIKDFKVNNTKLQFIIWLIQFTKCLTVSW